MGENVDGRLIVTNLEDTEWALNVARKGEHALPKIRYNHKKISVINVLSIHFKELGSSFHSLWSVSLTVWVMLLAFLPGRWKN